MTEESIDIKENELIKISLELIAILLRDETTGKNILWATDDYKKYGEAYYKDKEIKTELITSHYGNIIKPRIEKSKLEQKQRVQHKAEVFTPAWVCNMQNNIVDKDWFGRENIFNIENQTDYTWQTIERKIKFPNTNNRTWQDYIFSKRLEITCGEAPYITSRYDTVSGEFIEPKNRIGILDRKLRIITENTSKPKDWLKWAQYAVQSIYGFDWQGDNVLLSRENILFAIKEYYAAVFGKEIETNDLIHFAKIITWNIWQMDGLKFVIPNSCYTEKIEDEDLYGNISIISNPCRGCQNANHKEHNGIYCIVKDWQTGEKIRFADIAQWNKESL